MPICGRTRNWMKFYSPPRMAPNIVNAPAAAILGRLNNVWRSMIRFLIARAGANAIL